MSDSGARTASIRRPFALGRVVLRHVLATDVPFMAGAIAYQAFISLMPLLFLLAVAATALGGPDVTEQLLSITVGQLPAAARDRVRGAVRHAVTRTGNSVVGVGVLGFGAFAVFNGFDKAFTELYGVDRGATFPDQITDAGVVLATLAVALLAIAAAWQAVLRPSSLPVPWPATFALLAVGLAVTFYPMFYVFPEVSLGWREVLPGVALAAVAWTALQAVFQLYVRFVARSAAFGVISSVLLLATWLYFSGFALLVGGALNAVLHGYSHDDATAEAFDWLPR